MKKIIITFSKKYKTLFLCVLVTFFLSLSACNQLSEQTLATQASNASKLKVVATTTIVGDVVSQIGGEWIELTVLLPLGVDPHSFNPSPQDIAKVAEADLIFANGAGLEEFLEHLIESAGAEEKVIHVSEGIEFLMFEGEQEHEHEEDEMYESEEHGHDHNGADPHTWIDPNNVLIWVHNIEHELSESDPGNMNSYANNAQKYEAQLRELDTWIRSQVAQVSEENRKLVTDHSMFGYYVTQYGFEQVGTLIPAYSTLAEPSAQDLARIEDAIKTHQVKAVFVGNNVNDSLAKRVAEDTGIQLVFVYTGSLSEPGGEAGTYLDYMRYNTRAFVESLK